MSASGLALKFRWPFFTRTSEHHIAFDFGNLLRGCPGKSAFSVYNVRVIRELWITFASALRVQFPIDRHDPTLVRDRIDGRRASRSIFSIDDHGDQPNYPLGASHGCRRTVLSAVPLREVP